MGLLVTLDAHCAGTITIINTNRRSIYIKHITEY